MMNKIFELVDIVNGNIYENYSGRFMYGKTCVGIVCSYGYNNEILEFCEENDLPEPRVDNMGLENIFYWPSIEYSNNVEEEEYELNCWD